MSSSAILERPAHTNAGQPVVSRGWLIGPWFDILCIANLAWPLLILVQLGEGFGGRAGVQFWQLYFITTPHRWITLALVLLDRPRFQQRRGIFLGIFVVIVAVCGFVYATTGALTCLLAIDYVWNAWHFAAQHHGIYRIYGRLAEPERNAGLWLEKWAFRLFLLYVIVRVAGATWSSTTLDGGLRMVDWIIVAIPAGLVLRELSGFRPQATGRFAYLLSVVLLYLSLLWAVHTDRPALVLSLATASALFHAVEYLSIVGWSVQKRSAQAGNRLDLLAWLAPRWGITLCLFMVILGAVGWLMDQRLLEVWLFVNVIVAFLHYAYDGLIWRKPRRGASSK